MNVEINTEEIRNVGENLYPELADDFNKAHLIVSFGQNEYGAKGLSGSGFLPHWASYNALLSLFLETSAKHLNACGQTLVDVANEHDWVDEDNSHKIDQPYESSLENEVD